MPNAKTPNSVDIHIGERVRMYRIKVGMSQTTLGKELGVTFQQVQKYEKGTNRMGASRLHQISEILNVSVVSLFEGLPEPKCGSSDNAMSGSVEFLGTTVGQRLAQSFMQISEKNVRANLVQLIESIVENRAPPVPRQGKKNKSA